jgi:hypothetical protein
MEQKLNVVLDDMQKFMKVITDSTVKKVAVRPCIDNISIVCSNGTFQNNSNYVFIPTETFNAMFSEYFSVNLYSKECLRIATISCVYGEKGGILAHGKTCGYSYSVNSSDWRLEINRACDDSRYYLTFIGDNSYSRTFEVVSVH